MAAVPIEEQGCEGFLSVSYTEGEDRWVLTDPDRVSVKLRLFYDDGLLMYRIGGEPDDIDRFSTNLEGPLHVEDPGCPLFEQVDAGVFLTDPRHTLEEELAYSDGMRAKVKIRYTARPIVRASLSRRNPGDGIDGILSLMEDETGVDIESYYEEALAMDRE